MDASVLKQGLINVGNQATAAKAARAWSDAYRSYAQGALSPIGGIPASLDANAEVLIAAFVVAFSIPSQNPSSTAQQIASALTAAWLLPPIAFVGSFPGVVTAVLGTAALAPALVTAWAANLASRASTEQAAETVSAVIDAFSRTVIVTSAVIPTPVIGPIS